jgi:hypothetical protein
VKAALVTGAAGGIGRAIGDRFAGSSSLPERFGRLDAVVANAGFQHVALQGGLRRSEARLLGLVKVLAVAGASFGITASAHAFSGTPFLLDYGWTAR